MPEELDEIADDTLLERCGYVGEGRFDSPVPDYPGFIRLPHPFMGRHYKAWMKVSRDKSDDPLETLNAFKEWRSFVALLEEWAIDGVPRSDVTPDGDSVPERVKFWARTCMAAYLADVYSPKAWRRPSGTTS